MLEGGKTALNIVAAGAVFGLITSFFVRALVH